MVHWFIDLIWLIQIRCYMLCIYIAYIHTYIANRFTAFRFWWLIDSIMHLDCDDSFIPSLHVPQSQQTQSSSTNDSPDRTWESRYKYIPLHPTLNKTSAFLLSLCNLWFWEWALISQRERNRQRERYGRRRRRRRRGEQKNPDIGCYRLHREVHSSCRAIAGPSHLRSHQILHHRLQTRPCPIPPICRHLHPPGQKRPIPLIMHLWFLLLNFVCFILVYAFQSDGS